jgi:tetratricopeptide (TPR) repeat protein
MKALIYKTVIVVILFAAGTTISMAQRVIKGTVYRGGKPAAGVVVEAHKSSAQFYTSFDGKYEIQADPKSKYLKFTFSDEVRKLDIEGNESNLIDYSFDGAVPAAGTQKGEEGVNTKTAQELMQAQDTEFMNALSLYLEFFKQNDYKSAIPHWKILYDKYPKSTLNVYIHGYTMYDKLTSTATTPQEKEGYLNILMQIYDQRMKYFNQKGFVLGRKGTDWLKYKLVNENLNNDQLREVLKKAYPWLEESVKEQGKATEAPVYIVFFQTTVSLFKLGELPRETVVKNYDILTGLLPQSIAEKPNDKDLKTAQASIEQIFGTSGAADCNALTNIYAPQFDSKSNDKDFVKAMLRRLNQANCDESELFSKASEKLYQLEPSAEAAFNMARMFVKKNDHEKAQTYYRQAMEQETDQAMLENYYYEYALFIFAKDKAYQEARNYLKKALAINPQNCKALMLIGDIYIAASSSFSADNFEKSTVFWVAADYYTKAKNAGVDCAGDATQKIQNYRKYFPNKEEAFFRQITKEGQPYKVEGWINENTTARF